MSRAARIAVAVGLAAVTALVVMICIAPLETLMACGLLLGGAFALAGRRR